MAALSFTTILSQAVSAGLLLATSGQYSPLSAPATVGYTTVAGRFAGAVSVEKAGGMLPARVLGPLSPVLSRRYVSPQGLANGHVKALSCITPGVAGASPRFLTNFSGGQYVTPTPSYSYSFWS